MRVDWQLGVGMSVNTSGSEAAPVSVIREKKYFSGEREGEKARDAGS